MARPTLNALRRSCWLAEALAKDCIRSDRRSTIHTPLQLSIKKSASGPTKHVGPLPRHGRPRRVTSKPSYRFHLPHDRNNGNNRLTTAASVVRNQNANHPTQGPPQMASISVTIHHATDHAPVPKPELHAIIGHTVEARKTSRYAQRDPPSGPRPPEGHIPSPTLPLQTQHHGYIT